MVLYMASSFWLLGVESRDFSHDEKKRTACKDEQIHKMTTFFTQNCPRLSFWVKIVVILLICLALQAVLSFSTWEKSRDSTPNSQTNRGHVEHLICHFEWQIFLKDNCLNLVIKVKVAQGGIFSRAIQYSFLIKIYYFLIKITY